MLPDTQESPDVPVAGLLSGLAGLLAGGLLLSDFPLLSALGGALLDASAAAAFL